MPTTLGRRGVVLLLVIALLAVATVSFISVAQWTAMHRQQSRHHQWRLQATILADAGLQRAVAQLALKPEYQGEVWQIAADEMEGEGAVVQIHVEPAADSGDRRSIRVEADYPANEASRSRQIREQVVEIPKGKAT